MHEIRRTNPIRGPGAGAECGWIRSCRPVDGDGVPESTRDAHVFVAELAKGVELGYDTASNRAAWAHVVCGEVAVNGVLLHAGDAAAISGEKHVALTGGSDSSEVLVFDLG
jgi:quercetin 2,3-dioxygenase